MASKKKLLQAAAGSAGGAGLDVDEVFSTFLYDGNGSAQNINNGINLGDNIAGSVDLRGTTVSPPDSLTSTSYTWNFGTGDFTIEFWVYIAAGISSINFIDFRPSSGDTGSFMLGTSYDSGHKVRFYTSAGGSPVGKIVDTASLSTGAWHHLAWVRSSGTTKIYKNGVALSSTYSDTNNYSSSMIEIGQRSFNDGLALEGKMSNLRIVIGTAVYTSNFTVPTEPLTAISGTELLIFTADTFQDKSGNNREFTKVNTPTPSSSSPFTGNTGEGGLVWIKNRDSANGHNLEDTERGAGKRDRKSVV